MSQDKPSPEEIVAALREGRWLTASDGSVEIGPDVPIDPEEQARADAFMLTFDAPPDDDPT